jgi:hypothetical protein
MFVLLVAVQLTLSVTVMNTHVPKGAVVFYLVLLVGLAYGSGLVWGLLLVINAVPLLGAAGVVFSSGGSGGFGSGVLWGNVAVLFFTSLALLATLLSPAMRRHVGSRRHRTPGAAGLRSS